LGYGYGGYGYGGYGYPSYGYGSYYDPYDYGYAAPAYTDPGIPADAQPYTSVPLDNRAHVTIQVPNPNADVMIDGTETSTKGMIREFQSPPLAPGQYTYEVRATWTENGKAVTQTRKVGVSAGSQSFVNFLPDGVGGQSVSN
jgi:uncharacterized protein (TIGR03000 family)